MSLNTKWSRHYYSNILMDGLIVYQIKYQFICMIIDWLITNELCDLEARLIYTQR